MKRIAAIGLAWILLSIPAFAEEFDAVVEGIESHYGIQQVSPRLIGLATFFAKPALWGSGTGGLRVAAFENDGRTLEPSLKELDRVMLASLDSKWHPFVRVDSRKDGEAVVIYSTVREKHMTLLIGSVERDGVSLVQIRIDPKAFEDWRTSPGEKAKSTSHTN
jgi:hypothetical protein